MSSLIRFKEFLSEMAIGRDRFKSRIDNNMTGIFREFLCNEIAKRLAEQPAWDVEISKLVKANITDFIADSTMKGIFSNSEKIKTKAVIEVLQEFTPLAIVLEAKDKLIKREYYPKKMREIEFMDVDGVAEFKKFVVQYFPEKYHGYQNKSR